ncbi:kinase-like domain-containing protein [Biscogniauxia marginata]|nr:kinase-like domain-containing protein [Biscogniauxia marginata]
MSSTSEDEEIAALFREVNAYFTTKLKLKGGKAIGSGAFGGAWVYNELDELGQFKRKVVIKAALEEGDETFLNEVQHLTAVLGAEHIVRLLYVGPMPNPGRDLSRYAFVMDFVEHGTWVDILIRFTEEGKKIPNRILWGVFLCLARACVGMAYPRRGGVDDPPWRETIDPSVQPETRIHRDMNFGNVLPRGNGLMGLQLIDFGLAKHLPVDDEFGVKIGIKDNINEIARVVMWLAIGHRGYDVSEVEVRDGPGEPLRTIMSRGHGDLEDDCISDDLKYLIRRCRAYDLRERPRLDDLVRACEHAVFNHTAADYANLKEPWNRNETDDAIDAVIQKFILDAPY